MNENHHNMVIESPIESVARQLKCKSQMGTYLYYNILLLLLSLFEEYIKRQLYYYNFNSLYLLNFSSITFWFCDPVTRGLNTISYYIGLLCTLYIIIIRRVVSYWFLFTRCFYLRRRGESARGRSRAHLLTRQHFRFTAAVAGFTF